MTSRLFPLLALGCALAAPGCAPATTPAPSGSASPGATASPAAAATPTAAPTTAASATPAAFDYAEGCEHMGGTATKPATAILITMSRERDRVAADHTRYDVTLTKNGDTSEGYVLFENDEATDVNFYLSKDVPFKLMQDGKAIAFEATEKSPAACAGIKARYTAPVGIGPVELHFGPTAESAVSIVLEHGAHDHEH